MSEVTEELVTGAQGVKGVATNIEGATKTAVQGATAVTEGLVEKSFFTKTMTDLGMGRGIITHLFALGGVIGLIYAITKLSIWAYNTYNTTDEETSE